jgi:NAD(P)H dehydrogenase (quinone)
MKNILIINGNPKENSFSKSIAESYKIGAHQNAKVELLNLNAISFDINQIAGLKTTENELEPGLIHAQSLLKAADHIVWIYPIWWGGMPALLKGFIDRTFLSGFAFQYRKNSMLWDKLLTGKTARIIVTMDGPSWYFKYVMRNHSIRQMKYSILKYCGIKVSGVTYFGKVRVRTEAELTRFLKEIEILGFKEAK